MSKQPPPAPTASAVGPCPTIIQISRTPWHWKFTQHNRTTRPPRHNRLSVTPLQVPVIIYQACMIEHNSNKKCTFPTFSIHKPMGPPGRVAQSVGHPTRKSGVLGSIPGLATYFRFSFRFFKKGSCQLLAKVCARSTG